MYLCSFSLGKLFDILRVSGSLSGSSRSATLYLTGFIVNQSCCNGHVALGTDELSFRKAAFDAGSSNLLFDDPSLLLCVESKVTALLFFQV